VREQLLGGRYRLVGKLGEGGMGQVWEARDESLDRRVAVKVISRLAGGGQHSTEARARFLREARLTARLRHPGIAAVHDLGEADTEDGRVPFLVMELLQGEGLDARLRRGAVSPRDAARWGGHLCDALAHAHDAGITHRDLKPSNILITPSGTAQLLDFGIARATDPYATSDRLTQTGFIVGTPPYMAPEQARGFPEPRSDLYALGCVLFELITGRLPFQAPDTLGYLSAHLTQDPPAPSSVRPDVPAAWDDLVLTLLSKDPDARHPDAGALARELRRIDHAPTHHAPDPPSPTASPTASPPSSPPAATKRLPPPSEDPPPPAAPRHHTPVDGEPPAVVSFARPELVTRYVKRYSWFGRILGLCGGVVGALGTTGTADRLMTGAIVLGVGSTAGMVAGMVRGRSAGSDVVTVDHTGFSVSCRCRRRVERAFVLPWTAIEHITLGGTRAAKGVDFCDEVRVWFRAGGEPAPEWLTEHRAEKREDGSFKVYGTGDHYPRVPASRLHEPLAAFAGPLFLAPGRVPDAA
jgi:serine/threonine-protein kinase